MHLLFQLTKIKQCQNKILPLFSFKTVYIILSLILYNIIIFYLKGLILEIIGYIAAIIILYSLFTRNILRTRWLNFSGGILLGFYGITIGSYPLIILGIVLAVYNIYYVLCVKLGKGEKFFRLMFDAKFYGQFSEEFIKYHKNELTKYFPDVEFEKIIKSENNELECCYVFRDMTPIGLFLYRKVSNDTAEILVDYIEHKYFNLIEACFLTRGKNHLKNKKGIKNLYTYTAVPSHVKYIEKLGFCRDDQEIFKFTLEL